MYNGVLYDTVRINCLEHYRLDFFPIVNVDFCAIP